jgi:tetratricopeptide (TPR) repeat protein
MIRRFFRTSSALWQDVTLYHKTLKVTLPDITTYSQLLEAAKTKANLTEPEFVTFNSEFDLTKVTDDKTLEVCLKLASPKPLLLNLKGTVVNTDFEPQPLTFMYSQAKVQMEARDFAMAASTYSQCIDRLKTNPEKLGELFACQAGLAQCYLHLNRLEEARTLLESILTQYTEAGIPEDSRQMQTRIFLAETLLRQSKFDEATNLYVAIEQTLRATPQPLYSIVCWNLGDLYTSQNRIEEAGEVLERGLRYSRTLDARGLQTADLLGLLAVVETIKDRYAVAEGYLAEAFAILLEKQGPAAPDTTEMGYRLATVIKSQGRLAEAQLHFEGLLGQCRTSQRPKDSNLANYLLGYAEVLFLSDRLSEAREAAQEALDIESLSKGSLVEEAQAFLAAIARKAAEKRQEA